MVIPYIDSILIKLVQPPLHALTLPLSMLPLIFSFPCPKWSMRSSPLDHLSGPELIPLPSYRPSYFPTRPLALGERIVSGPLVLSNIHSSPHSPPTAIHWSCLTLPFSLPSWPLHKHSFIPFFSFFVFAVSLSSNLSCTLSLPPHPPTTTNKSLYHLTTDYYLSTPSYHPASSLAQQHSFLPAYDPLTQHIHTRHETTSLRQNQG